jgi:acyl-CoA thioester hydrolase
MIETYRGIVYPSQIDHMGHMNVQYYAARFDEATWNLCSAFGITSTYMHEEQKGMAALEQLTKYKAEVMAGTPLVIRTRMLEVGEKTARFIHVMYNAETMEEVASSELLGVHLDRKTRKSCPFPPDVLDKARRRLESSNKEEGHT